MLLEFVLFLLTVLIVWDVWQQRRLQAQLGHIPIVSRIPLIGNAAVLSTFHPDNLHLKFSEFVRRFGKTFYARVFGYLVVTTADPRYIDQLLSSQRHLHKSLMYQMLSLWLGDGLLLAAGDRWQKMRKIITPTFHFKILEQFVEVFDRNCTILVEKLSSNADGETVIDIYPHMALLTLDVIAETAMGVSVDAQLNAKSDFVQAVKDVTNIVATRFMRPHLALPILFRLFTPSLYRTQMNGIATMHDFTNKIIVERHNALNQERALGKVKGDEEEDLGIKRRLALLDVLLHSTLDGAPLTDTQIRDEVNTFMFEGHDTTTSAAAFCLYLISRHETCQQKLFEEIRAHFGDDLQRPIIYADIQNLNYLNCVIKESLRLYPPVPAIGRHLKEEFNMGDVTLPANTNVLILLWSILRDPDVFADPQEFRPERHFSETTQANAYSNIPFSAGPRNCIGQKFALLELRTIVIKMVRNFELLPLGKVVEPSIKIVLRSKSGINLGIKKRLY